MATVTVTSACNTSISQSFGFEDNAIHLRDASFSSYLSNGEETFTLKHAESTRPPPLAVNTATESFYQISFGRKYNPDGEINIFDAEKYFRGGMDGENMASAEKGGRRELKKEGRIDLLRSKTMFKSGTPSICSEVSGNSQTALLPRFQKDPPTTAQKQATGKRFFSTFGCSSCSGKKSVNIDEKIAESRDFSHCKTVVDFEEPRSTEIIIKEPVEIDRNLMGPAGNIQSRPEFRCREEMGFRMAEMGGFGFKREDCFTFPILNHMAGNMTVGRQLEGEEKARISLDVFGSPFLAKDNSSPLRRLTMLTSDTGRRIEEIPASTGGADSVSDIDNDLGSDSSSDLFEIESLTRKAYPLSSRRLSDDVSSFPATTTCYEPSEASIEWSVVTASAADFPVPSDYDDLELIKKKPDNETRITTTTTTTTATTTTSKTTTAKTSMVKEAQRRRPNSLLGCKSSKSVKVAADAYRVCENSKSNGHRLLRSDSITPFTMFQPDIRVMDFDSAHVQRAFSTRSHTSHSLYMH